MTRILRIGAENNSDTKRAAEIRSIRAIRVPFFLYAVLFHGEVSYQKPYRQIGYVLCFMIASRWNDNSIMTP